MKILNILQKPIYLNRIKTFGWNLFYTAIIFVLALATDIVPELGLNETATMIVALVVAQLSKLAHEMKR
jgi:magnesium-transporting ATPase (P-type)